MSSTSVHSIATMKYSFKKRRMPLLVFDKNELDKIAFSPDSRWRPCIFVSASRKSDRSFIGTLLPDLFSVMYHFSQKFRTPQTMGIKIVFLCSLNSWDVDFHVSFFRDFDFTVTLSSQTSFFVFFAILSEQLVDLKWLITYKHKRCFP